MHVERVVEVTEEIYQAVTRLVPYLGAHKTCPTRAELEMLARNETSVLLIARVSDGHSTIAGMLTITLYRVPTGGRSIVEDLVVDGEYRGMGIAKTLLQHAIEIARAAGANGVALTSNPQRVEANQLYLAMGFQKRETNAYFYKLS